MTKSGCYSAYWKKQEWQERQFMNVIEYRHVAYGRNVNSEDQLQEAIISVWRNHTPRDEWFRLFHPANGGQRNAIEAAKFKRMGVVAGIADLVCLLPDSKVGFIELKFGKNGTSIHQDDFARFCKNSGYPYALCRTVEEALDTLKGWGAYDPNGSSYRTLLNTNNQTKDLNNGKEER
jgi:hypothetical protein